LVAGRLAGRTTAFRQITGLDGGDWDRAWFQEPEASRIVLRLLDVVVHLLGKRLHVALARILRICGGIRIKTQFRAYRVRGVLHGFSGFRYKRRLGQGHGCRLGESEDRRVQLACLLEHRDGRDDSQVV
jgi:hypothetical protein